MVDTVANIIRAGMEAGAPSRFAFEASCRHGIRSGLCEDGWPWHDADLAAGDVVSRALAMTGATRPTWKEGQPEWTQDGALPIERERCIRCAKPLPEGHWKFCSVVCKDAHRNDRRDLDAAAENNVRREALRSAWSAQQPKRECEGCGGMFRPRTPTQRFCRNQCIGVARRAGRWR
ncbi:hypothetical protein [Acuticoccus sediminis]|uniref:hypothetical protein n=1 Tax=Acuticoccus sediminis TaxID=2184697 RepID=UPI0011B9447F|nr:hypothetical protein [Acuticoccus sediminis]